MTRAMPEILSARMPQGRIATLRKQITRIALALVCLAFLPAPSFAQSDSLVQRLPGDAWFYVHWHGTSSLAGVRSTNSVLRLLRDPAFAVLSQHLVEQMKAESAQKPASHPLTQEDVNDFLSLLENPAIFGILNGPGSAAGTNTNSPSTFLIFDMSGKLDQFARFRARIASQDVAQPERIPVIISRIPVTKVVSGTQTSYEAETGSYFVRTDSLPAMAELLPRLTAASQPTNQIQAVTEIPSACRDVPRNSLVDFLVLPGKLNISQSASNPNFNLPAFVKALHADQIHAACGDINFEATATRVKGVVLGDTSPGSVLNLFGGNRNSFATMALAPSGAAYQCTLLDFAALYSALKSGFTAALPPERAGMVGGIDSLLAISWGMAPAEALQLFTGEFAVIRPHPSTEPSQMVYALSIQQPDKVLALVRKILSSSNPVEKSQGDTTYLTLALPSGMTPAAQAGASAQSASYTLAVSPNLLIASQKEDVAREAAVRAHNASGAGAKDFLSADPAFQRVRSLLPMRLNSLSYTDLAHFNWAKMASDSQKKLNAQMQAEARTTGKPVPPAFDFFRDFDWEVIPRYLQFSLSGGWKDASGIYFDSYIQ